MLSLGESEHVAVDVAWVGESESVVKLGSRGVVAQAIIALDIHVLDGLSVAIMRALAA